MKESDLKENISKAVKSIQNNPLNLLDMNEFSEGLYQNFLANPNLMRQVPDLSYEDLESYIHEKVHRNNELLSDLDLETIELMTKFPIPPKKA